MIKKLGGVIWELQYRELLNPILGHLYGLIKVKWMRLAQVMISEGWEQNSASTLLSVPRPPLLYILSKINK